ncbi:MAG: hypothetical protein LLF90_05110 [Methanomicrobiaceae archaeon]|nr:hypothetical protein [Methanomicrobiaceae archaeon]
MKKEEHRAGEEGYRVRREENRELERRSTKRGEERTGSGKRGVRHEENTG